MSDWVLIHIEDAKRNITQAIEDFPELTNDELREALSYLYEAEDKLNLAVEILQKVKA